MDQRRDNIRRRTPAPPSTSTIMLPMGDADGEQITVSMPLDELLELIGQQMRWSMWRAPSTAGIEGIVMRTLARLSLTLAGEATKRLDD
jgi:hypothetical protein